MSERLEDQSSQEWSGLLQDLKWVPYDLLQTKWELLLSQQQGILEALRNQSPQTIYSPQIFEWDIVHENNNCNSFDPQFDELIDQQRVLAESVQDMWYVGQRALEESRMQTEILESLWDAAMAAHRQRNSLLKKMWIQNKTLNGIENILWKNRETLENIDWRLWEHWKTLNSIDRWIDETNFRLTHAVSLLWEIWWGIVNMTNEMVTTRIEILEWLERIDETILWCHREQMNILGEMNDTLRNPRRTWADEDWKIWEECRQSGDYESAARMFWDGIQKNPSDPRNYFSLWLIQTFWENSSKPKESFLHAAVKADKKGNNLLSSISFLQLGILNKFDKENLEAIENLSHAIVKNPKNYEAAYQLAICYVRLGGYEQALYILEWLVTRSQVYRIKVIMDPEFFPIHQQLMELLIHLFIR